MSITTISVADAVPRCDQTVSSPVRVRTVKLRRSEGAARGAAPSHIILLKSALTPIPVSELQSVATYLAFCLKHASAGVSPILI